jgi:hypothetical protein
MTTQPHKDPLIPNHKSLERWDAQFAPKGSIAKKEQDKEAKEMLAPSSSVDPDPS